jgi:site-specific DNA-methyltransferase (adenine-specific)
MMKYPDDFMNKIICADCLDVMRQMPDKCVDLVLTDPPYGIGISSNPVRQKHEKMNWDDTPPSKEYFKELFRVSKNQIIWGGNYFDLPSSQGFIIWDKVQPENFSLAMCEYAYSSIKSPAKMYRYSVLTERNKQHPTQKPLALFKWIVNKYTKESDIVFDAFIGSGTTAVACKELGRTFIGIEKEPKYCKIAEERLRILDMNPKFL